MNIHLNLTGPVANNYGQVTAGRACGTWSGNTCYGSATDLLMKYCSGGYRVYYLRPSPACNYVYCIS